MTHIPDALRRQIHARADGRCEYCQFHAKQGLVLFIGSFVVMILGMIPVLGWLIILPLGWLIIIVLSILGIVNALAGKKWEMPFLGQYAKKIHL